ncbi:MAG: PPC domain-containing protein [Planctomycetaceae bacterium]|jgi:hypothetical protein|nr:PPC domain-containing protein [Planctomycetaceae bacterium]
MRVISAILFCFLTVFVSAQERTKIGYVYPAGGQQGTALTVLVGGRQIAGAAGVLVSGNGVRGRVLHGYPSLRINNTDMNTARQIYNRARKLEEGTELSLTSEETVVLDKFLYLDKLNHPAAEDLQLIYYEYFSQRPDKKPKETLAQGVLIEITIDSDAEPGERELRLAGNNFLTKPVRFIVGTNPEIKEIEPNDFNVPPGKLFESLGGQPNIIPKVLRQLPPPDLPVVLNGQIRAGDVDLFPFHAKAGQKLILGVKARTLTPYLADAVPGWFQAEITLYDSRHKKIAEAASYQFDPDPVLFIRIPEDGIYYVEIRDSLFRGRDDFVYRLSLAESPVITSVFPLGGRQGTAVTAILDGWNLPVSETVLDTNGDEPGIRIVTNLNESPLLYPFCYEVETLPEMLESEPNGTFQDANEISLPVILNGRISENDNFDNYSFHAQKGERIVFDVKALVLNSPLDASLELYDIRGNLLAANDDRAGSDGPNIGRETHHADPYLTFEIPDDGTYLVRLFAVHREREVRPGYRLRISTPRPDFEVYCEPSTLVFSGNTQPVTFHVIRKDGFVGDVRLKLPDGFSGWQLEDARISSDTDKITVPLTALKNPGKEPVPVSFDAVAEINGKETVRHVIPADDMEQAFIYHHLVPSESLLTIRGRVQQKK